MKKLSVVLAIVIMFANLLGKDGKMEKPYVIMETSMGTIEIELWPDVAPETVANFVGLANGTKEWTDPKTGEKVKKPFYDGLIFHRVIPDFMIQAGCPLRNGTGGPGYTFKDEFAKDENGKLKATHEYGVISMANAGPNTNGSQFFIVTKKDGTAWLDGRHTVFGRVMQGIEVAKEIEAVKRDRRDKPLEDVVIKKVTIK